MEKLILFQLNSGGDNVKAAILPLLKLITLTLFGFLLVKYQIISKPTLKILSKLVFVLFLPCLIFTYLGPSITLKKMIEWWFIPVNVVISTTIGCILGYMVALICQPPPELFRFTIIMTGFGNTGNISVAVITSICETTNPFGTDCYSNGVAYVSFSQWIAVILVYTFVYHMMEPTLEYYESEDERGQIGDEEEDEIVVEEVADNSISIPLLAEAEWIGMENDEETGRHNKSPFVAKIFNSIDNEVENSQSIRCLAEPIMVKKIRKVAEKTPVYHILQPATITCVLAIIIGIIPAVKSFVYGEDAPLEFITDSLEILSEAMVPSVMLVLGGILAEGRPSNSNLGIRTTVGIIATRLFVMPMIGIGIVFLADKWNMLIEGDLMYRFVLLMQYTTPSAILLGALANLRGYAVKESSALLFWQHACALVSLSIYIIVYFNLLLSYV
ncbi:Auxin efflux carrier family protein [Euphorbia peplus]|nr:Auxin efflux carrier family protein [Euphorbia peplus]